MEKKTALMIDEDLVARAKEILGTRTTTETIRAALQEIVNRELRSELVAMLASMDPADLKLIETSWD